MPKKMLCTKVVAEPTSCFYTSFPGDIDPNIFLQSVAYLSTLSKVFHSILKILISVMVNLSVFAYVCVTHKCLCQDACTYVNKMHRINTFSC